MAAKMEMEAAPTEQTNTSTAFTSSAFDSDLHRSSASSQGGLRALISKDKVLHSLAMDEYFKHWENKNVENETEDMRRARRKDYSSLTRQYYNLTTDIYEYAWGESLHFCRFARGESFSQAIARHEHYLGACIGIKEDMKVLDVGCGVGGPAREMVRFTGCHVTGLNISEYQLKHAEKYSRRAGLSHKLEFVQGDFMAMPFPDSSFDAVYAFEATVHAPSLEGVYKEIRRVLKPGGVVGIYEWLLTEEYDNDNLAHRRIRVDIEQAFGISNMVNISDGLAAIEAAGLELVVHRDLAVDEDRLDYAPWYWPMGGDLRYAQTIWELISTLKKTRWGVMLASVFLGLLAMLHIAPTGAKKTLDTMGKGADALVTAGRQGIFTPMYLLVARKPKL
ncbi:S-adenosyl-L-methionine-dependent methyltransferase [Mollisia scopiformis]|uniref:Sterol 24-C-methyltransferase n=1 Tax=Mollisia scopiformis TaxID=149040 RepID=A0A132B6T0_MOLSC|nr:S-adenosyl-L-methionine-dependent methyltransferase [Mollisia scopiformis]KUJ07709.1 S-adenosyl-L-methionine-dependent methyltransferase [Mollisia scopiformis]